MPELHRPTARLGEAALDGLPAEVVRPVYPRGSAEPAVVHFGVGAFHRSHQEVYLDELMNADSCADWTVSGVGLLAADESLLGALREQDYLYSVSTFADDGAAAVRVVGALREGLWSPSDRERILARLESPTTRIVSLTITEGGYNINEATGEFDLTSVKIIEELRDPSRPSSVFGYLVEGLRRRHLAGLPPFTVLSCDNIEGNGAVLRQCVLSYADRVDPLLASWISGHVAFPSSMVDRITPVATSADAGRVSGILGCLDAAPVVAEAFRRWVVEDDFTAGRPDLERVGVQFVSDVRPFELMKLRLLNGAHQALGYVAALLAFDSVHEAARDPLLDRYLRRYLLEEAASTVPELPGVRSTDYVDTVCRRFRASFPPDTVARLTEFGSDRLPKFVVPVIQERLERGESVDLGAHILASWALFLEGRSEGGLPIVVRDHRLTALRTRARGEGWPQALLEHRDLFGDLADHDEFMAPFAAAHASFVRIGVRSTLVGAL